MAKDKIAAGILLYRHLHARWEVLLVHPSGAYNRDKPWSIPKGLPDPGETLEQAARRETREEAGVVVDGDLIYLGTIIYQKSKKTIHCYAAPAPSDAAPFCASWEVDHARFMTIEEASRIIHPDQKPFLDRLHEWLQQNQPQGNLS